MNDNAMIGAAREAHMRAAQLFNPLQLSRFVEMDGSVPVVNASRVLADVRRLEQSFSHIKGFKFNALPLFCVVLNDMYRWDYSTPLETTTVYFEPSETDRIIFGGVYDAETHAKKTRVAIAKVEGSEQRAPYTYTEKDFTKLLNNLKQNA